MPKVRAKKSCGFSPRLAGARALIARQRLSLTHFPGATVAAGLAIRCHHGLARVGIREVAIEVMPPEKPHGRAASGVGFRGVHCKCLKSNGLRRRSVSPAASPAASMRSFCYKRGVVTEPRSTRMGARSLAKIARNAARRVIYAGDQVYCPLCERGFRAWVGGRACGRCPGCMAATRSRVLFLVLQGRSALLGDSAPVLHFAPEACLRVRIQPVLGERYVSTDLRRTDVTTQQDITKMTFPNGEFGAVICSHVLEHIPDDRRALSELARVTRPGGHLIVQVPLGVDSATDEDPAVTDPAERKRRWGEPDHLRLYGLDLADRIREAGFEVDVLRSGDLFDPAQLERCGLDEKQVVFVARRT